MFDSLEAYLRLLCDQGITQYSVTVQQCSSSGYCGTAVSIILQPDPASGLRIECGIEGCRCYPLAWEMDATPDRSPP